MEGLAEAIESSIHSRILKDLEEPLARIVHDSVQKAIVQASGVPKRRPVAGGRCAQIWDALDKESVDKGAVPTLDEVRKIAKRRHWNSNTARIQYYRWRAAKPALNA